MNNEQLKALNADEMMLMEKLNDILGWEEFEFGILTYTFKTIKFNGCAVMGDVLQLEFLDFPIHELIAVIQEKERSTVVNELNKGSVTFYDVRKAIHMFVDSNCSLKNLS